MKNASEPVKVLIVAADSMLALGIAASLQDHGYAIAGIARQAEEACLLFKENDMDIVLINIHMPGNKDACGEQDSMAEESSLVPVVGQKNGHDDVDNEIILRQGSYIFLKRNFQFVKVNLREILYMESEGNYVHIVSKDKKFTIRLSLMQAMRRINHSRFVRINRSAVVNMDAIQSFNKEQVCIAQYEIAIGKNYKESFFKQLGFR